MLWRYREIPTWAQAILLRFPILQAWLHRYRCPYPAMIADKSARACVEEGLCGCDNQFRYGK